MKKLLSCLIACTLLVLAVPCLAGQREGAVTVSPFVGGYTFDGVERLETRPMVGLRLGYDFTKNLGLEATFNYVSTRFTQLVPGTVSVYNYRLEGVYNFMPESSLVPYLAVGGGGETIDVPGNNLSFRKLHSTYPTANAGAGIKWFLSEDVAVRADYHQNFLFNTNNIGYTKKHDYVTNYEYSVGLQLLFGGAKPAVAAAAAVAPPPPPPPQPKAEEPPPPPPAPAPRFKYCTTFHPEFDICSAEIRAEYTNQMERAGKFMQQYPDTTAVIEGHTDNVPVNPDGTCKFKDNMELSQARAESAVNYLAEKFGIDRSRFTAKGYGDTRPIADNATDAGKQKNRRIEAIVDCAILPQQIKPEEHLCMTLQVEFDFGKADVRAQYSNEIAKLAEYMKKYPTTNATIEGHTDNVGSPESNMKLSQQRAENVVSYLVDKFGIDRSRLTATGYGDTRPIAYNTTPEGRQKNRRIDAVVDCVIKK